MVKRVKRSENIEDQGGSKEWESADKRRNERPWGAPVEGKAEMGL
jgi:hypothetical protein